MHSLWGIVEFKTQLVMVIVCIKKTYYDGFQVTINI